MHSGYEVDVSGDVPEMTEDAYMPAAATCPAHSAERVRRGGILLTVSNRICVNIEYNICFAVI